MANIQQLSEHLESILQNKVPKIYHRWLIEAEKMRKGGDYNLEINISYEDVNNIIAQAEEMLNFATENL